MRKIIEELLTKCKVVPFSEPTVGGHFYKVMTQQFRLPSGEVINREFLKKRPAAVVVPVTSDGNVVCVIQPISLSAEGSLVEVPAGYAEDNEKLDWQTISNNSFYRKHIPSTFLMKERGCVFFYLLFNWKFTRIIIKFQIFLCPLWQNLNFFICYKIIIKIIFLIFNSCSSACFFPFFTINNWEKCISIKFLFYFCYIHFLYIRH